jgi:hypothetical protein
MRTARWARWRRRWSDDRGAALVEAAIVLPVVVIIVFGIIEIGLLFRTASVDTGSTRSGARLGSAIFATDAGAPDQIKATVQKDLGSLQAWAHPVELWIYKAGANGDPAGGTCSSSCIKYTWNGTDFGTGSGSWSNPDACGQTIDRLGVFVSVKHDSLTGLSISRTVKYHTVMRLEPKPFGVCTGE